MAKVLFKRKTTNEIKDLEVEDGALIYNTDNGKTYMDFGDNRIQTGGNADTMITIGGEEAPTDTDIKIWIKDKDNQNYNNFYYRKNDNKFEQMFLQPTGDTLPIGAQIPFGGTTIPTNWLECNGQAVSRETYKELFSVIGTTYGDGDGSTTFNVPDFIGRVPVGLDEEDTDFDTLGETGGEKTHKLTISEMPSHNHTGGILMNNQVPGGGRYYFQAPGTTNGTNFSNSLKIGETGGNQPHNNMQPYTVTNFIIKAKQSVGLVGAITDNINDTNDNAVPTCETVKNYVDNQKCKYAVVTTTTASNVSVGTKLTLNSISESYGNFTLSNGSIVLGKGIKKVRVSGCIFIDDPNRVGYVWGIIRKNNNSVATSITPYANNGGFLSTSIPPTIIQVNEGDTISLIAESTCNGKVRTGRANTWVLVEVVE